MTPAKETAQPRPTSLSDFLRLHMKGILDAVGGFLNRLGLAPMSLTVFGLAGHVVAAVVLAGGNMLAGGLLLLFMAPVIIVFFLAQRAFVEGVTLTGVKG